MRKVLFILGELSDLDVDWMTAHGTKRAVGSGTLLIEERAEIDAMYVVLDGRFSVWIGSRDRQELAQLGAGELLGEMSFIDSRPAVASVEALEDSIVLSIPRGDLERKLKEDSGFAARFYRALAVFLSSRLRSTVVGLGYGRPVLSGEDEGDDLDPMILDTLHLAGARFDRMLKRLMGS